VNPLPESISLTASHATICAGQSVTLTASPEGAASYSLNGTEWIESNTWTQNPTETTMYSLFVQSDKGCTATAENAATVTVNSVPALAFENPPAAMCANTAQTLTIKDDNNAASSYCFYYECPDCVYNPYQDGGDALAGAGCQWQSECTYGTAKTYTVHMYDAGNITVWAKAKTEQGCENSASVTVAGNTTPAITGFYANPASICKGGSATLTATVGNANSNEQYSFAGSNWGSANTYLVTPDATATYTVQVTNLSGNCTVTSATSVTVTVNELPTKPTGASNPARCDAGTLTFSASVDGTCNGCTIDWYDAATGGSVVASGTSTLVKDLQQTTTYYAQAKNTNTACVNTDRLPVTGTVNPLPTIQSLTSATICAGQSATLTATADGASSYSLDGNIWQADKNLVIENLDVGTTFYPLYAITAAGCTATVENAATVTVNPLPDKPSEPINDERCGEGEVTLSATVANGITIDWYAQETDGIPVDGGTGQNPFTPTLNTSSTYYAQARNTNTACVNTERVAVRGTVYNVPALAFENPPAAMCANSERKIEIIDANNAASSYCFYYQCEDCVYNPYQDGGDALAGAGCQWQSECTYSEAKTYTVSSYDIGGKVTVWAKAKTVDGCVDSTSMAILSVAYPDKPTVNDVERCGAGTVTLAATNSPTGAMTYTWIVGEETPQTTESGSLTTSLPEGSTTYSVMATNATGCNSPVQTGTVNVHAVPTLKLASGSNNITVATNTQITPVIYSTTYAATATVTGPPTGVTGAWENGEFKVSGAPSAVGYSTCTVRAVSEPGCYSIPENITFDVQNDIFQVAGCNNMWMSHHTKPLSAGFDAYPNLCPDMGGAWQRPTTSDVQCLCAENALPRGPYRHWGSAAGSTHAWAVCDKDRDCGENCGAANENRGYNRGLMCVKK
jgi:hypothetical protein